MLLPRLYLQLGVFLDYYTGMHQPSVSKGLREILDKGSAESNDFKQAIPEFHRRVIPQIMIDENWPPTMLLHGTADTAVPVEESHHLRGLLDAAGVPVHFMEFDGKEHSFDYETDAEEVWKEQFDVVKAFLYKALG
jgi:acetyl esterase/lipase